MASSLKSRLHRFHSLANWGFQTNLVQSLHKEVAVFGVHNRLNRGAKHLHAILLENTLLKQLGAAVECGLTTKREQDTIRALLLDDFSHKVSVHRQEVHLVGNAFRGLNCSDVGVDQYRTNTIFTKGFQCLRT